MSKKYQYFKLYKRYEEDLWGFLSKSKKQKNNKALIYLYYCFLSNYKYKKIIQSKRLFTLRKKFLYRLVSGDVEFRTKKRNFKALNRFTLLKLKWFYGNMKRYQIKQLIYKYKNNIRLYGFLFLYLLESRLSIVLYRLNLFDTFFSIQQFIKHGNVIINNKVIRYPNYNIKLYDNVYLINKHKLSFYIKLKDDLKNDLIIQNYPLYIEANYKSMSFMMYKLPTISEVKYPFQVNLNHIVNNI